MARRLVNKLWLTLILVLSHVTGISHAASADSQYLVVLGSYADRDIAVKEVGKFTRQLPESILTIVVKNTERGVFYRVVDGPLSHPEAKDRQDRWQDLGLYDAWLITEALPTRREAASAGATTVGEASTMAEPE